MNFFRITLLVLFFILTSLNAYSDNHNTEEQNIVEKAKEINEKIKEKQAATQSNIDSEIGKIEEPLPLNDPFAGDTATVSSIVTEEEEVTEAALALRNYKLAATFSGDFQKFVTLVNDSGEFITLELFEELSSGVKLFDVNVKEAIFQKEKDGTYIIMNFKNQIKEQDAL
tara:strand:- start:202 stop:711 length:510 start_codon:yes stop_codon:yes gene_type:complete